MDAWDRSLWIDPAATDAGRARAGSDRLRCAIAARDRRRTELAEILLTERCQVWRVREGLATGLPEGWRLTGLDDVWLGAPSLSGMVAAADYAIELDAKEDPGSTGADISASSIEAG